MDVISDRAPPFFLSSSSSPHALPRKHSAPIGPYRPPASVLTYSHPHGRGSLLPMPPNYNEGSCWTLASLKVLTSSPPETRPRSISVEVTKISLRTDGRWAEEKPYILRRSWDEWLELRERIIQMHPETESVLPKLSKTHGFLESIFTNTKRHHQSTHTLNLKELNNFLSCLVGKCSKKVINSRVIQNFFQTEEMKVGAYPVQYTDDDLPVIPPHLSKSNPNRNLQLPLPPSSSRDDVGSIATHLQAFRFPQPNPLQSSPSSRLKSKPSQSNLSLSHRAVTPFEAEKNLYNEKGCSLNRHRPSVDPMAVIAERPPPPGSIPELQAGHILRPNPMGRNPGASTIRLSNKSRNLMRPTTGLTRSPPVAPSKRPNTSDARSAHDAMLKPTPINSMNHATSQLVPVPPTRRPSENYLGLSRDFEASKPPRPQLREFKSMQDMRGTASQHLKASGRSGRNGVIDPTRNNSLSAVGENSSVAAGAGGSHVRSPTNPWRRHRRTPSDSSSSFGSSQLSPISSVLSSPTVTPSTSTNVVLNSASSLYFPLHIGPRRSIDSLGPNSTGCDGSSSLRLFHDPETRKTVAHHTVPPAPFYPIPPRLLKPITIPSPTSGPATPSSPDQSRPHTSTGSVNGTTPSSLTLKVIHLESKTNIILAIQRGLFSLAQIRSKIQNKLKMAGEVELEPDWRIRLVMIDQEEFVRRDELEERHELDLKEDDGKELLELINGISKRSLIKKITLRIS